MDKIIITNYSALCDLYGSRAVEVVEALKQLVAADGRRDIQSKIFFIDSDPDMLNLGVTPVTQKNDEKLNKQAIDGVFNKLTPDYILIVGGPDIIPHQTLDNPLYDSEKVIYEYIPDFPDDVSKVQSDLPYACSVAYSTSIENFIAPSRVVGRLAGITADKNPDALLKAIKTTIDAQPKERSYYENTFYLCSQNALDVGKEAYNMAFGNSAAIENISPPMTSDTLPVAQLDAPTHFVLCHSDSYMPFWMGVEGQDIDVVMLPTNLDGNICTQAVVASICCYGAQLYNPSADIPNYWKLWNIDVPKQRPVCNSYFENGAIALCGSTSTAYGGGNGDYILAYFLNSILGGASVGRAFLEARLKLMTDDTDEGELHPYHLKTMAEFILLGDPSVHPVIDTKIAAVSGYESAIDLREHKSYHRKQRRAKAESLCNYIAKKIKLPILQSHKQPSDLVKNSIDKIVKNLKLKNINIATYTHGVSQNIVESVRKTGVQKLTHIVRGVVEPSVQNGRLDTITHIITEVDGKIVAIRKIIKM